MELAKPASADTDIDPEPPRAQLLPIVRHAVSILWDRLGLVLAISLTCAIVMGLPLTVQKWLPPNTPDILRLIVLCSSPLFAAIPTGGAFCIAHRLAVHDEASYSQFWLDGFGIAGAAVRMALIQSISAAVLLFASTFYLRMSGWLGRIGFTVCLYAALFWAMMLIYQWPALVAQEKGVFDEPERRGKRGALAAVRRSFYLALGRPFLTAGLLAVLVSLSVLMAVTIVMPVLIWVGTIAITTTLATRALLIQFGVLPPPVKSEPVPDELFRISGTKPTTAVIERNDRG